MQSLATLVSQPLATNAGRKRVEAKAQQPQPNTIQFINSVQPGDTTNKNTLTLIRSHVAKHSRALRREKRNPHSQRVARRQGDKDDEDDAYSRSSQRRFAAKAGLPVLAPKSSAPPSLSSGSRSLTTSTTSRTPSPIQLIGSSRRDARHCLSMLLTDKEQCLLDYYLTFVISNGYTACYGKQPAHVFQRQMKEIWLPFAMSHPCLMAAIFHVACRNYTENTEGQVANHFKVRKLEYRAKCLGMAKAAVMSERVASDATIALALLMASESYFEGDVGAFISHGHAITKMVRDRGGLQALGPTGYIGQLVGQCIFTPIYGLVSGPVELHQLKS